MDSIEILAKCEASYKGYKDEMERNGISITDSYYEPFSAGFMNGFYENAIPENKKKQITLKQFNNLLPGEKTKWEPVYSYLFNGKEYIKYQLLWYKPYIDIPRRDAE